MGQHWSGSTVDVYGRTEDYEKVNHEHFIGIMNHKYDIGRYNKLYTLRTRYK